MLASRLRGTTDKRVKRLPHQTGCHCGHLRGVFSRGMDSFIYSVWFLDTEAEEGDQDREWIACFAIQAVSAVEAQSWGDRLAKDRSRRFPNDTFVRSSIEREMDVSGVDDWSNVPRIAAGQIATEATIGW